jgi:predicted dehydrogenase
VHAATPVRLALIGLGAMGLRHLKALRAHPEVKLTAAVEIDPARCPADIDCPVYTRAEEILGQADGAIIAIPTAAHAAAALPLLRAGISCLIEKPYVAARADLEALDAAARTGGAQIQVGHIERFNPAMTALLTTLPSGDPVRAVNARRISGASARVTDIDVVLDLMVHDIDAVLAVKRCPVQEITAAGSADHASAVLTFTDGSHATLIASRIAPWRVRDLDVLCGDRALHLDYIARSLTESRHAADGFATSAVPVAPADALTSQLTAFVATVRGADPAVSAADGSAVMEIAWRIREVLAL